MLSRFRAIGSVRLFFYSSVVLLQACVLPIPSETSVWVHPTPRFYHFYSNGLMHLTLDKVDGATYLEIFVPVDGISHYTSADAKKFCEALIPASSLDNLKAVTCYKNRKETRKYLTTRFGDEFNRRRFDPDTIVWQDDLSDNFETKQHNGLRIKNPATGELLVDMPREKELAMYHALGNNHALVDVLEGRQQLTSNDVPYNFNYDYDGKFLLQVPPQHIAPSASYSEIALSPTEQQNLSKQPGEARILDVNFYEYKTGHYGTWHIPVKYLDPKAWPTWAHWTLDSIKFISAYKHGDWVTLVQRQDSSDYNIRAVLYNIKTHETAETQLAYPLTGGRTIVIYDFEHFKFYSINTRDNDDASEEDKLGGPYLMDIIATDIRSGNRTTYQLPITFVDNTPALDK